MKRIGILYLCTGPYVAFWKEFFESFERNFLPDTEKHYYVFTDSEHIDYEDIDRVNRYFLEPQPWPLVTLLRFQTFLRIEGELNQNDFLMFSNANMACISTVFENEFLPDSKQDERLCFTIHPGYYQKPMYRVPYDRNPKSKAYVPYNKGNQYVIGAMFCGETHAFLEMSRTMRDRINEDLKRNVIARWHDESHINHYILTITNYKLLSCSFCYPYGIDVPMEKKIVAIGKEEKFDIKTFKGQNVITPEKKTIKTYISLIKEHIDKEKIFYYRDFILRKKLGD